MSKYTNLPELTELLSYVLYSDYIKMDERQGEVPLSTLVVARAGGGKTSLIEQFNSNDGIQEVSDITAYGLVTKYKKQLMAKTIRRFIIPDLINPTNRKKATVDTTITFFNSLISWEGVRSIHTYATDLELAEPLHASLMTTMATKDFARMVKGLSAVGFLRRLVIVGYEYEVVNVRDILHDIARSKSNWQSIKLTFPQGEVDVKMTDQQKDKFAELSIRIASKVASEPFGTFIQLYTLCKSRAISMGRDFVNDEDVRRIVLLADRYVGQIPTDIKKVLKGKQTKGG